MTAIREFTDAIDDVRTRHGTGAWEHSPAMREISDERGYEERCSWEAPIGSTHALGDLTLRAACDYVRAFAEVFTAPRIPFYGHLVAARAALESSVISSWLSEAGIARDERVKRGLSEYLYSSTEEGWLGLSADAAEHVDEWVERAASLGWEPTDRNGKPWSLAHSRGQPRVDGVGRPSIRAGITDLLVSNEESEIGKLLVAVPLKTPVVRLGKCAADCHR